MTHMKKLLSKFFVLQSLSLLTVFLYGLYLHEAPAQLAFTQYVLPKAVEANTQAPDRIAIPSLGIDLQVYKATIVHDVWPTTDLGASYLSTSPLPGETGNSIIYGHNWTSLFGKLVNARVGDTVIVTYPDKTKKTFVIAYTSTVSPDESTILASSTDKRITIYTCTGLLDSKRFVAVA